MPPKSKTRALSSNRARASFATTDSTSRTRPKRKVAFKAEMSAENVRKTTTGPPLPLAHLPRLSSPDLITFYPSNRHLTFSPFARNVDATKTTTITTSAINSIPQLDTTQSESEISEARRQELRVLQATSFPHVAGVAEPDLNDRKEVKHFEVNSQGSLTFLLLDDGEAWKLREVDMHSELHGQMIAGRFYVVERIK